MINMYKSDHKMFFELIENLTNKEKLKEIDIDTRRFQKKLSYLIYYQDGIKTL